MNKLIFSTILFLAPALAQSAPVDADLVRVGETNTIPDGNISVGDANFTPFGDSSATHSIALGTLNQISFGDASVIAGASNIGSMTNSLMLGQGNYAQWGGLNSVIIGYGNGGDTPQNSLLVGSMNYISYNGANENLNSLVSGALNNAYLDAGFIAGYNNYGEGRQFILGEGLIAETSPLMVAIGKYNATPTADQLFVVGNGTATQTGSTVTISRKNAFELLSDGKINLYGTSATVPSITIDPTSQQITIAGQPVLTATSLSALSFTAPSFSFNSGSNNRLTIDSSGNFGIGNTTPSAKVDIVQNQSSTSPSLSVVNSYATPAASVAVMQRTNAVASGSLASPSLALLKIKDAGGVPFFVTNPTETTPYFIIQNTGSVGIGTTSPSDKLDVFGNIRASSSASDFISIRMQSSTPTLYAQTVGGYPLNISNNSFTVGLSANGFGGNTYSNLTLTSGSRLMGIQSSTSLSLFTNNNTTPRLVIDTAGNVGVGTSAPAAKFEVNGSVAVGTGVTPTSYASAIVGTYNRAEGSSGTADTDPLFTVANGTGVGADAADKKNHNAFVVYKDGKVNLYAKGSSSATPVAPSIVLDPNTPLISIGGQQIVTSSTTGVQTFTAPSYSFNSAGGNRMTIDVNGDVGIGTANPDGRLGVSGGDITIDSGRFLSAGSAVHGITGVQLGSDEDQEYVALLTSDTEKFRVDNQGNVGIGTSTPQSRLTVDRGDGAAPTATIGRSMIDWAYEQGADSNTYYTKIADVGANGGAVQIEGLLGGGTVGEGKATVNLLVSEKNLSVRSGSVIGNLGTAADITVLKNGDGSSSIYLVSKIHAEVNLRVTGTSAATVLVGNPQRVTTAPSGTSPYTLSTNAQYTMKTDGSIVMAKRQGDIKMGEFGNGGED